MLQDALCHESVRNRRVSALSGSDLSSGFLYSACNCCYLCLKICMLFFSDSLSNSEASVVQLLLPSSDIDFFSKQSHRLSEEEAIIQTAHFYFPFLDLSVQIVLGIWGII